MVTSREKEITQAARKIRNAWKNGKTIKPIRQHFKEGDVEAAYAIQQINNKI